MSLFAEQEPKKAPLADRLRPMDIADVVGQEHLLGEGGFINKSIAANAPASIILWGPPGCGKTTLARLYAKAFEAEFIQLSAVFSGVADVKKAVQQAKENQQMHNRQTVLFIDEIHRFNKAQQDAFLPYVEDGTLILVGATTENPSFELNKALLSRASVLTLNPVDKSGLEKVLKRAEEFYGKDVPLTQKAKDELLAMALGDARFFLNVVEVIFETTKGEKLDVEELKKLASNRSALYDKAGDEHYNLISALHKSIRGSDPDAALYWFNRMLVGGEDPLYVARRLIRVANEDIGLADPQATTQTIAARQVYETLGSPEGELALAQAVVYLALAPKSNALYTAYKASLKSAHQTANLMPPKHILNAPTQLMSAQGYGKGYDYDHNTEHGFSGQDYFPESMGREKYYQPFERGFERDMKKRMDYFENLRQQFDAKQ